MVSKFGSWLAGLLITGLLLLGLTWATRLVLLRNDFSPAVYRLVHGFDLLYWTFAYAPTIVLTHLALYLDLAPAELVPPPFVTDPALLRGQMRASLFVTLTGVGIYSLLGYVIVRTLRPARSLWIMLAIAIGGGILITAAQIPHWDWHATPAWWTLTADFVSTPTDYFEYMLGWPNPFASSFEPQAAAVMTRAAAEYVFLTAAWIFVVLLAMRAITLLSGRLRRAMRTRRRS